MVWLHGEVTSNSNLELPKLVLCFCQKLSGLIISATWMQQGKDSCKIFSSGLMESHLDPRMSTITVNPRLQTSSLERKKRQVDTTPGLAPVSGQRRPGELGSASVIPLLAGRVPPPTTRPASTVTQGAAGHRRRIESAWVLAVVLAHRGALTEQTNCTRTGFSPKSVQVFMLCPWLLHLVFSLGERL